MLRINKKVGETPLQALDRLRKEKPELEEEVLSYAGRLDPMAEGEMIVLLGDENKEYKRYLAYDKEYVATFMVGMSTDTGDALGLITDTKDVSVDIDDIKAKAERLKDIKEQKYPWFSSQTVDGIKLFDHFKAGNTSIERPSRAVEIKQVELLGLSNETSENIKNYIWNTIEKVKGDFRQQEILETWNKYFTENTKDISTFELRLVVASGTYIRALTENFDFPVTLLKLNRTKILDQ